MPMELLRSSRRAVMVHALAAVVAGMACVGAAQAQEWPSRPVTLVVPYAPGASNDLFTRALANVLSKRFNQPFVVENRVGAGGFTGTNSVAKAAPDGYTYVEMPNSIAGFKPIMKVDLDPSVDLTPVGILARSPIGMHVPASLPVTTVKEFIDYAKANPDKVFYGMAGIGTTNHQHSEMFNMSAGLKIKGVNYKSAADVMTDLMAGRLQLMFSTTASTTPHIQSGKLRLLAYTDGNFPPTAIPAPTLAELGVPNMEKAQSWWAVFAPSGTPDDIKAKMNAAINDALKDPEFADIIRKAGATPSPATLEEAMATVRQEIADVIEFAKTLEQ